MPARIPDLTVARLLRDPALHPDLRSLLERPPAATGDRGGPSLAAAVDAGLAPLVQPGAPPGFSWPRPGSPPIERLPVLPPLPDLSDRDREIIEGIILGQLQLEEGEELQVDGEILDRLRLYSRPVIQVQDHSFQLPPVELWRQPLEQARARIQAALPTVGRVDLAYHPRASWVGTAWLIAPGVVVTNRHVATSFARGARAEVSFRRHPTGTEMVASVDFRHELDRPLAESFTVQRVLWLAPDEPGVPDVAFLELAVPPDSPLPAPVALAGELPAEDDKLVVIGYPGRVDEHRASTAVLHIFLGRFGVKTLHPGTVTAVSPALLCHDSSTLAGNSGSMVLGLDSGQVLGLHFGGEFSQANWAVPAPVLRELVQAHVG